MSRKSWFRGALLLLAAGLSFGIGSCLVSAADRVQGVVTNFVG